MSRRHSNSRAKLSTAVWRTLRFAGFVGLVCLDGASARADIAIGTGKLSEEVTDYTTGGEDQLAFIRYYYSSGPQYYGPMAPLGMNWRSNYDRDLVFLFNSALVILEQADGQVVRFKIANGAGASVDDTDLNLVQSGDTWIVKDKDGTEASFGPPDREGRARVVTIKSVDGYTQTLSYSPQNQLTAVTDSHGRTLAFTYAGAGLSTVATPDGMVLSYAFDSDRAMPNYRLASVHYSTDDQQRNRSYLYENSTFKLFLTGVLNGDGKRLATWTYDEFGRCTSSRHADSADLTTIRYDMDADGPVNTVTNGFGEKTVYKFKKFGNVPKIVEIDHVATAITPATTMFFAYDANGRLVNKTDSATTDPFRPQFKAP